MKQHRFLLYPAGAPGAGLLILRVSVTAFLLAYSIGGFPALSAEALALDMLGCLIGLGLCMRSAACGAMIVAGFMAIANHAMISTGLLAHILDAGVLALVGPGAFSLDARLFGRATFRLRG